MIHLTFLTLMSLVLSNASDETDIDQSSESESEDSDTSSDDGNVPRPTPWLRVYDEQGKDPPPEFPFDPNTGPKNIPGNCTKPVDFFMLLFTTNLLLTSVRNTNSYAAEFIRDNGPRLRRTSAVKRWVDTSLREMKAFVAIVLNMGLIRKPTIYSYWSTTSSQLTPWFTSCMPRERFQLLMKFFHLVRTPLPRPGDPNYDPCARFDPIVQVANETFKHYYVPRKQLSIDESLIGTKNKTQLMQYLPNKHHHKWGIKLWMLCEAATAYVHSFYVYRGKRDNVDDTNLSHKVVVKLLEMSNLLRKGYHVFIDNFFTGIKLALELLSKRTYTTGTIRRNRKGLPVGLKKQLKPGEMSYFRKDELLGVAYRQKKSQKNPVLLLTTKSMATATEVQARVRGVPGGRGPVTKPDVVLDYNKHMGGVDQSDMMMYAYLDERRTVKYWKKVTFSIINRMVVNSYILYKESMPGSTMTHYGFVVKVVEALVEEQLLMRQDRAGPAGDADPSPKPALATIPDKKEKDCTVCSNPKGPRKRSRTMCTVCQKGLHGICFGKHKCKKAKKQ